MPRVLDRRVTDAGAEEEDRHTEPADSNLLQLDEGTRFPASRIRWDDRGHRKEAEAGLQMLASALAAAFPRTNMNRRRECAYRGRPGPFHRFLENRREGNEGRLAAGRRPLATD